jgi:hypothetical protein
MDNEKPIPNPNISQSLDPAISSPSTFPASPPQLDEEPSLPWYSLQPTPWYSPIIKIALLIYFLNIIAWGGMLFLLLVNASPATCHPTCNDINSPRRIWIEWDSQILNALFCVTGFGLAPFRFRDTYFLFLSKFGPRATRQHNLLRVVGWNSWFRLGYGQPEDQALALQRSVRPAGYFNLNPKATLPDVGPSPMKVYPHVATSKPWKLWGNILLNLSNTGFQITLATFMWADDRYVRPSWATGLFVALGCIAGAAGGIVQGMEGGRAGRAEKGIEKKKKGRKGRKVDEEAVVGG